ncbi:ATP-binding cassette domain-containing protein [Rathayibacter rubneri]
MIDGAPVEDAAPLSEKERTEHFGKPVLEVDDLHCNGLTGITLSVRAGEILGIYGLIGSGRSRFLKTIYGAEPIGGGSITFDGQRYAPKRPGQAIAKGVAFLSEERKFDGFIPQMTSIENVVLPVLGRYGKAGILNWRALKGSARTVLDQVTIRGDVENPITSLSGGNQQKALFARATLQAPRLLLLDEPTKGVDIGAKREIYGIIRTLAREKGVAVIVVSSEEEELTGLADTITVFRNGHCDGAVFDRDAIDPTQLREMAWADAERPAVG